MNSGLQGPAETKEQAEKGDAEAQFALAEMFRLGQGFAKDLTEAALWYRKAAEQGQVDAQCRLGLMYLAGEGTPKDITMGTIWTTRAAEQGNMEAQFTLGGMRRAAHDGADAIKWYTLAADSGHSIAQYRLAIMYRFGEGVPKDLEQAIKWYTKAAEGNDQGAQIALGIFYSGSSDGPRDGKAAVKWYRMAAEQGSFDAQQALATLYWSGNLVPTDKVLGFYWASRSATNLKPSSVRLRDTIAMELTSQQLEEARRMLAENNAARRGPEPSKPESGKIPAGTKTTGSGFFVSATGYFVTNHHVVDGARHVRLKTASGIHEAEIVRVDAANDLALLKAPGSFPALHVRGSGGIRLGDRVFTVGYPNPALQGLEAKFGSGEVAATTGFADDPRHFQISIPIQPGNSGGPLVDFSGNVVGVITSQLNKLHALKETGNLSENVNYAVKSTILIGLLESVADLDSKMQPDANSGVRDAATVVKDVAAATALVLVE